MCVMFKVSELLFIFILLLDWIIFSIDVKKVFSFICLIGISGFIISLFGRLSEINFSCTWSFIGRFLRK